MNQPALIADGSLLPGAVARRIAHQCYGARLSCPLIRFGVIVGAAGYAPAVGQTNYAEASLWHLRQFYTTQTSVVWTLGN